MPPEHELVLEWLARADDDLRLAELAVNARPPVLWGAAFHAQQAAEKLLKALLTFHRIEFEKVHSLDYLVDLCATAEPETESVRISATKLTDFAVEPRYPFPRHDPTETEAGEAIEIARQVQCFVRARLPAHLR
jgi:HEPN domain-containing protein